MTTIVEQLSAYSAGLRYDDLPGEVVHQAKRLIVDTVGCALGGSGSEPAKIARDIAGTVASTEPATSTSQELAARIKAETRVWTEVIREAGIKAD